MIRPATTYDRAIGLDLSLEASADAARRRQPLRFTVTIINRGDSPVELVDPGDGSESGWRTPVIAWSVLSESAGSAEHPEFPELPPARCGSLDPLTRDQIFVLAPGESRVLPDWLVTPPGLRNPGRYRLVFYYRNDPCRRVRGVAGDAHDPDAIRRIRRTTPCDLRSNEIVVRILP